VANVVMINAGQTDQVHVWWNIGSSTIGSSAMIGVVKAR
jgi:hypothetical protein